MVFRYIGPSLSIVIHIKHNIDLNLFTYRVFPLALPSNAV